MVGGVDALRQDIYIVQQHNAGCNWKFCQQSMPQYMHFVTIIGHFHRKNFYWQKRQTAAGEIRRRLFAAPCSTLGKIS